MEHTENSNHTPDFAPVHMSNGPRDIWTGMRLQFPVTERWVYLNHAAVSPLPLACKDAMQAYLEELTRNGAARYPGRTFKILNRVRGLAAALLGAKPENTFIVRSTTQGLGIAATGIPFAPGDNVVLVEREFPANIRPWLPLRRRDVQVRMVPHDPDGRVRLDRIAEAVDDRTRAVSISFVQFLSGFRINLAAVAEICRKHDALFVVDAIQGLGALKLDVEAAGIDFLSADSHKWLLGPEGVGVGYCSDRALERIEPALEGWLSVTEPFEFLNTDQPLKPNAARFEDSAYNVAGFHGFGGSLELLLSIGIDAIQNRVLELTDILAEGLTAQGWTLSSPRDRQDEKSGIVTAVKDGVDTKKLDKNLRENGFVISAREGGIRVSPHGYNNLGDLERFLTVLSELT